ncbi:hypothetical protein G6011_07601 [Alternaria panax]|uniref:Uncharacterized protein n=1 Tax=Alternaria panax TaxID=48097 RepID=A0AAD4FHP2_9PLEO|nr:hypothetical protein G6011_07601 [Alternaria panax]
MASQKRTATSPVNEPSAKERRENRAQRRAAARHAQHLREKAHRDKITKLNPVNSPLLGLPSEIRNMIFEQIFFNTISVINM